MTPFQQIIIEWADDLDLDVFDDCEHSGDIESMLLAKLEDEFNDISDTIVRNIESQLSEQAYLTKNPAG